ncbi:unnamed protein product, partial [Closterium sp. NIES-54]
LHLQPVELLLRGDSLALAFHHAMARGWRVSIGVALLLSLRAKHYREHPAKERLGEETSVRVQKR